MGQSSGYSGEDMFAVEERFFLSAGGGRGNLFHSLLNRVKISFIYFNILIYFI